MSPRVDTVTLPGYSDGMTTTEQTYIALTGYVGNRATAYVANAECPTRITRDPEQAVTGTREAVLLALRDLADGWIVGANCHVEVWP